MYVNEGSTITRPFACAVRGVVRIALATAAAAGALLAGGCATGNTALGDLPASEMTGHYATGADGSWFVPCGAVADSPGQWVTLTGESVAQVERARTEGRIAAGQRLFVRWRAAVTMGGEVGPRGPGQPALLVREVLELRPAADHDCARGAAR